ncbi:unnamed protein product [Alopecurus aequalis]
MAAAVLRFTAMKVFEQRRLLLPRIFHGRSSIHRFSCAQSPNIFKNNKQGAKPVSTVADDVLPPPNSPVWKSSVDDLPPDSPLWKIKLGDLPPDSPIWNMKVSGPPWCPAHPRHVHYLLRWAAGTVAFTSALVTCSSKVHLQEPCSPDSH